MLHVYLHIFQRAFLLLEMPACDHSFIHSLPSEVLEKWWPVQGCVS